MGVLDFFSKKRDVKRRNWQAAQGGRLYADWNSISQTADESIASALQTVRDRTREQARNNDYVRRYLSLLNQNVVGPAGIRMRSSLSVIATFHRVSRCNLLMSICWTST